MEKNFTLSSNVRFTPSEANELTGTQINQNETGLSENDLPSDAMIANILSFSKALRVEKSNQIGLVEVVLN